MDLGKFDILIFLMIFFCIKIKHEKEFKMESMFFLKILGWFITYFILGYFVAGLLNRYLYVNRKKCNSRKDFFWEVMLWIIILVFIILFKLHRHITKPLFNKYLKVSILTFFNATDRLLESINSKIKQVALKIIDWGHSGFGKHETH